MRRGCWCVPGFFARTRKGGISTCGHPNSPCSFPGRFRASAPARSLGRAPRVTGASFGLQWLRADRPNNWLHAGAQGQCLAWNPGCTGDRCRTSWFMLRRRQQNSVPAVTTVPWCHGRASASAQHTNGFTTVPAMRLQVNSRGNNATVTCRSCTMVWWPCGANFKMQVLGSSASGRAAQ